MTNEPVTPAEGQVPAAASGQVPPVNPQVGNSEKTAPQSPQLTLEQALDALDKARKENADSRVKFKRLDELEAAAKEAEMAKLSELEKVNKRAEAAEARATKQQARLATLTVSLAAQKLGCIDPDLAALAITGELEYDDDGNPTNADKLLEKLAKDKPHLFTKEAQRITSGGATNPARSATTPGSELSHELISRMSPAEYDARRAEINAWKAQHPLRLY